MALQPFHQLTDPARVLVSGTSVTLDPLPPFESLTAYYVEIQNTAFTDTTGNAFAGITGPTTWTFTAGDFTIPDTTPPAIALLLPANDATGIASNAALVVTFSENVATGTGYILSLIHI